MPRKTRKTTVTQKDAPAEDAIAKSPPRRSKRNAAALNAKSPASAAVTSDDLRATVDEAVEEGKKPAKRRKTVENKATAAKPKQKQKTSKPASNKPPPSKTDKASEPVATAETPSTGRSYWLMKAEPNSRIEKGVEVKFSIDDLKACTEPEPWTGVRNHVAKNNMVKMKKGDLAFFYHSNTKVPGIVGIAEVVREASVDESAFDPTHPYHDPKSTRDKPRWYNVHVAFHSKFPGIISLKQLQSHGREPGDPLAGMQVVKMGRLSVSRVSEGEWRFVMGLVEDLKEEGKDGDQKSA